MPLENIFTISTDEEFNAMALKTFQVQYNENLVYQEFCRHLGKNVSTVKTLEDIPFLPIEFLNPKSNMWFIYAPDYLYQ